MYYPYFRGKQFELIAIREQAALISSSGFTPIIEPVRSPLKSLEKTIDVLCENQANCIIIINPEHGDLSENPSDIHALIAEKYMDADNIKVGILLKEGSTTNDAILLSEMFPQKDTAFIHSGFLDPKGLASALGAELENTTQVFLDAYCSKLYMKNFSGSHRVLLRDGFEKRRNADHPDIENFSDLHITYPDEGMDGFGDFLTVGDDYSESGGPAYAIAIHLTYIDPTNDDIMMIYHFVSVRKDTPTDPAGKFREALQKLNATYATGSSHLHLGTALTEFLNLHQKAHFPGLGQVKKLSIVHHMETLAANLVGH